MFSQLSYTHLLLQIVVIQIENRKTCFSIRKSFSNVYSRLLKPIAKLDVLFSWKDVSGGNFKLTCFTTRNINQIFSWKTVEVYECEVNNRKEMKLSLNYFRLSRNSITLMVHGIASHHNKNMCISHISSICHALFSVFRMWMYKWCSSLSYCSRESYSQRIGLYAMCFVLCVILVVFSAKLYS